MSIRSHLLRSATSDSIAGRWMRSVVLLTLGIAFGMTGCSSLRDVSGVQADSLAMKDTGHPSAGTVAPALYVTAFGCCIEVYNPRTGKFRREIPGPTAAYVPGFIAVGPDGTLYVPNSFGEGFHTYVYAPDATKPKAILNDGYNYRDSGACVDTKGTVYVVGYPFGGEWVIEVYANGATTPTRTINGGGTFEQPNTCAVDPNGNIYATFAYSSGSQALSSIREFPVGSGSPKDFGFTSMVNMDQLALDDRGDFVVAGNSLKGDNWGIWVFKKNSHRLLRELPIQGGHGNWGVAFSTSEKHLYVTSAGPILLDEYDWATGKVLKTFSWKGPNGSPPESEALAPVPQ